MWEDFIECGLSRPPPISALQVVKDCSIGRDMGLVAAVHSRLQTLVEKSGLKAARMHLKISRSSDIL